MLPLYTSYLNSFGTNNSYYITAFKVRKLMYLQYFRKNVLLHFSVISVSAILLKKHNYTLQGVYKVITYMNSHFKIYGVYSLIFYI